MVARLVLLYAAAAAAYTPRRRVQPPKALRRTARGGSAANENGPASAASSSTRPASASQPASEANGATATVQPTWAPLAPLGIGAATACLGVLYAAALQASLRVIWSGLPARRWLVPAITTAGGVAVGGVAVASKGFFGVGNFVAAARGAAPWPRARAIGPLLVASLLTTATGLSVGPEAPMVAAGAVCGAAIARRYRLDEREAAFAGAAGALTTFLGFPIAGAVFVHELVVPGADMAPRIAPTALATVGAALAGGLLKGGNVGGHFNWGAVAPLSSRAYLLACGVGVVGALVGGFFVAACDQIRARSVPPSRRRELLVRAGAGLLAGLVALRYPQSLFWGEQQCRNQAESVILRIEGALNFYFLTGEQSLQTAISGVSAPEKLLFPVALQGARAAAPFGFGIGVAKLAAIALAAGAGCPGGVIFPLFFAAGALAHGAIAAVPALPAATAALLMAAVQASVTRTPLSTALMLAFSGNLGATLTPLCAVSAYVGVWTARALSLPTLLCYPSES